VLADATYFELARAVHDPQCWSALFHQFRK